MVQTYAQFIRATPTYEQFARSTVRLAAIVSWLVVLVLYIGLLVLALIAAWYWALNPAQVGQWIAAVLPSQVGHSAAALIGVVGIPLLVALALIAKIWHWVVQAIISRYVLGAL
jgi:hypothetical protein